MTLNGYRHTPSPDFLMRKTDREKTEGIAEYVVNHGKFSFSDVPFGPADSLVFSILSYLTPEAVFPDFDGRQKMPLKRLAQLYERHYVPPKHPGRFSMEARAPELLYRLAVSARFSEIAVTDYESYLDEEKESQFAAMTFSAQNGSIYITYRGTDDHIIGWKEDFNMSCCDSVPSQKRALLYLKQQAEREETERIFLGGHSKGGNLAVYAAAFADRAVQRKIAGIHSFDSPGFSERFFSYPGYRSISGRIINFMPENSMVGRLFEHRAEIRIVRSRARGFLQHIPFYWCISGSDFIYTGSFGRSSRMFAETMRNWISGPDDEEKKDVCRRSVRSAERCGHPDHRGNASGFREDTAPFREHPVDVGEEQEKFFQVDRKTSEGKRTYGGKRSVFRRRVFIRRQREKTIALCRGRDG